MPFNESMGYFGKVESLRSRALRALRFTRPRGHCLLRHVRGQSLAMGHGNAQERQDRPPVRIRVNSTYLLWRCSG